MCWCMFRLHFLVLALGHAKEEAHPESPDLYVGRYELTEIQVLYFHPRVLDARTQMRGCGYQKSMLELESF